MFIASCISLVLSLRVVVDAMCRYPETLGLIMAVQLLLGRYTGYRLMELFRFRDFLGGQPPRMEAVVTHHEPVTLKIAEVEAVGSRQ
jgi:7 transmembrane helices usually fused to an inactive transglutaminase